jgi:hypothetical protein
VSAAILLNALTAEVNKDAKASSDEQDGADGACGGRDVHGGDDGCDADGGADADGGRVARRGAWRVGIGPCGSASSSWPLPSSSWRMPSPGAFSLCSQVGPVAGSTPCS